jgi:uncharacterized protein YbcI
MFSKGELEDKISRSLTAWEKDYLGRGPLHVKTDIIRNMIVVVLKGILTPAEQALAKTTDGLISVKKIRTELVESGSSHLKDMLNQITGATVLSMHTDVSTQTGERVIVFLLDKPLAE